MTLLAACGSLPAPTLVVAVVTATSAPATAVPDLDGGPVDLADFRGSQTLVLFWNPRCGFCQQMLPDLRAWEAEPPDGAPGVLVVSTGTAEENHAMGLRWPVLLDRDFAAGQAFDATGTPMAVLRTRRRCGGSVSCQPATAGRRRRDRRA